MQKKYFIGLDIGTNSVGFAVTDTNYNIIKKSKKELWGVRLFDDAKTASDRRIARASRRRLSRKKERLELLQNLFDEEIAKVDEGFFLRLKESMYHFDDKTEMQYNSLFNDDKFKDREFMKKYKTVYHLRKALINGEVTDVRMLYLGIAHILKNRGHFLFEKMDFSEIQDFNIAFDKLNEILCKTFDGLTLQIDDNTQIEEILKNKSIAQSVKEKQILNFLPNGKDKMVKAVVKFMVGGKVDLRNIFENLSEDFKSITLQGDFEAIYTKLEDELSDDIIVIDAIKAIYDWSILTDILKGETYLSNSMENTYNEHNKDLKTLKKLVKTYIPCEYNEIFNSSSEKSNYCAYIGTAIKNGKKVPLKEKICSQDDFCTYINKKIDKIENLAPEYQEIIAKIREKNLLPKQRIKSNAVIPMQVHLAELTAILKNNKANFEFLNKSDGKYTISEKILMIFNYRIPYYVGPLNENSSFAWLERKKGEKIYPWNFDEIVDKSKSAENFIRRMTNKCTYIKNADVLPKNSILYSKFMVLNELNNLKINGDDITIEQKQDIFNDLFLVQNKVTQKGLKKYLKKKLGIDCEITGIDGDFKANMKSYLDFKSIYGDFDENMAEDIIRWITLFSQAKDILKEKILQNYDISAEKLEKTLNLKYSGYGKLSKELLCDVYDVDKNTGEAINIIDALYLTNFNLMQLLSKSFNYKTNIDNLNFSEDKADISYDDIENLYCSPAVKKSMWQSVKIVREIEKIMGYKPEKLFIETTREDVDVKKRTVSRHKTLMELYKNIKKEYPDIYANLEKSTDDELRIKKMYLYYTQLGRCAYTNKIIEFSNLKNNNLYDIEHIYPRSKTKDDSIHNNLVLVEKTANLEKTNIFPIPQIYRQNALWKLLLSKKLINQEKYNRLMQVKELSDHELEGFIARQLVETSQATKAVAEIFKEHYKKDKTTVCYVKANHVSDFRKQFDMIKCRDVNDYHHAKDAYLNIVVGNVFNTKFTEKFFLKSNWQSEYTLNPDKMYNWDIYKKTENDLYYAWKKDETIKTVKNVMSSNKILFTRKSYKASGVLFDLNPKKAGTSKTYKIALKSKSKFLANSEKYGYYGSVNPSYYCLIECISPKKVERCLVSVPIIVAVNLKNNPNALCEFLDLSYKSYTIKIPVILINSLVNLNGYLYHLSGGKDVKNAVQLQLSYEMETYAKELTKSLKYKNTKICVEKNIELFYLLKHKIENTIYSKCKGYNSLSSTLENGKETFETMDLEEQSKILISLLKILKCSSGRENLKAIGGSSETGRLQISLNISKSFEKAELINQSITGFYENRRNLLE